MLSPGRGCSPPPPPPGPSPSARRKSMLAVRGDTFGPPALTAPYFAPWGRSRRTRRPTGDPGALGVWEAAPPPCGWPGTGCVPTSLLSAAARHLQLTLPKFPAPARWPCCVRPRVRRAGGPSLLGSRGRTEQARRRRCWRRGFKETATSPQFAGLRWGCSRFPDSRSTAGPSPGSGRHSAAAPEEAEAQCTSSGSRFRRVESPDRATASAACLALTTSESSPLPWQAETAVGSALGPSAQWKEERAQKNAGEFFYQESAHFPWMFRCDLQQMLRAFSCPGDVRSQR
ncbi:uncharacterized protein LOC118994697 [Sturnira hondurensis]|uniref:uncharacterized protein LOC118994697 n=1 Tax=Sturnira hondurensis TaxID=192404 RepID=UPI001879EE42|nr:uncharacterized protein LOC118994697 [Sturnira hondurensis]